jgi:hypothetical protein
VTWRRNRALAAISLALVVPALTSCGFNYPTDRVYTPGAGVNFGTGSIEVLNAAIVSKGPNAGTFIASFSNSDQTQQVSLAGLSGAQGVLDAATINPFPIGANGLVNLANGGGINVQGTFTPGQFVSVSLKFDNGDTATDQVPVVADQGQWAGLDTSKPASTDTSSANASPSATPSS